MNRQNLLILPLLLITFFIFVSSPCYAKIYINEISSSGSSDWVELYNDGDSDIDLAAFKLQDTAGTPKELTGSIGSNSFVTIDWYNRLDNAGDTVKLVSLIDSNIVEDEISYGDKSNTNIAPYGATTLGRKPDGSTGFILFSVGTKNSSNNNSELGIPPTVIPTNTPKPTSTPKPTKTPAPTDAPAATRTPSPTRTPTPSRTPTPTRTPTPLPNSSSSAPGKSSPTTGVLGAASKATPPSKEQVQSDLPTPRLGSDLEEIKTSDEVAVKGATTSNSSIPVIIYFIFGAGAICIIACGILFYRNRNTKNI